MCVIDLGQKNYENYEKSYSFKFDFANNNFFEDYYNKHLIYRKEIDDILQILEKNSNYRILILGPAGSGKTTLLQMLYKQIETKESIKFLSSYELDNTNLLQQIQSEDTLFIDGLDESQNPHLILQEIEKHRNLICTSRATISYGDSFSHTIFLSPLTMPQVQELFNKFNFEDNTFLKLLNNINEKNLTPLNILLLIQANLNNSNIDVFYSEYKNLVYQFGNGVDFSSGIIVPKKELVVPSKEIVKSLTILNENLLKQAQKRPEIIHEFSPREFEIMICELLEKQGYNVKLTKQSRDGGKDIIIVENSLIGDFCTYVECKKYARNNPIRVQLVRELYGTVEAENATAGMLITTSYFTKDAKEYTQRIRHRMALRDYNDLVKELKQI